MDIGSSGIVHWQAAETWMAEFKMFNKISLANTLTAKKWFR